MKKLSFKIKIIFVFLTLISILIAFTIKDSYHWSSIIFYAFPLPVIIFLLTSLSVLLKNMRAYRLLFISMAILIVFIWCFRSFKINSHNNSLIGIDIAYWNVSHSKTFKDAFDLAGKLPDVIVLVEADSVILEEAKIDFPSYYFLKSKKNIAVGSKLPIQFISEQKSKRYSNILNFETHDLTFFAVDMSPNIFNPKAVEFNFLNENIRTHNNAVILGDFNTPFESIYFDDLKRACLNVFTEKGNGFRESWFWNIPLLSLDHIWVSKTFEVIKAEKVNTLKSDHAMIKTTIKIKALD